jgi:hypothetical protein
MSSEIEQILDRLHFTTEALQNVSSDPLGPSFSALLDERSSQLQFFQKQAQEGQLSPQQGERLRHLIELGDEVRTPLMVRRALIRERLDELKSAKQAQRALAAGQPPGGHRLNVRG